MTETDEHTLTAESGAMRDALELVLAVYDDDAAPLAAAGIGVDGDPGREPLATALLTFISNVVPEEIGRPRAAEIIALIGEHEADCEAAGPGEPGDDREAECGICLQPPAGSGAQYDMARITWDGVTVRVCSLCIHAQPVSITDLHRAVHRAGTSGPRGRGASGKHGQCPRCGTGIDRDRQCTVDGESLVIDEVTDPFTGEERLVAYCRPCAIGLWPELLRQLAGQAGTDTDEETPA